MNSSLAKRVATVCLFTLTLLAPIACSKTTKDVVQGPAEKQLDEQTTSPVAEQRADAQNASSTETAQAVVTLTVDYGDGAQKRFPAVPWRDKMTVFDTLTWAAEQPHGIQFEHRGEGPLVMVGQIDDLKNGGGNGKNWIFRVNGELANSSCGIAEISAGDAVLWQFDVYR